MANVLRRQENTAGQRFEKDAWLDESSDRLEPEAADRLHFSADFVQLRDAIGIECQFIETFEIFGAGVLAMRWTECFPDRLPNAVLLRSVRSGRDWRAGFVSHGDLCNGVAPRAVILVAEAWVVRVEFNDRVAIEDVVAVCHDHTH